MRTIIFSFINTLFLGGDPVLARLFTMLGHKRDAVKFNNRFKKLSQQLEKTADRRLGYVDSYVHLKNEISKELETIF